VGSGVQAIDPSDQRKDANATFFLMDAVVGSADKDAKADAMAEAGRDPAEDESASRARAAAGLPADAR
jgi:hypothetical protein